MVSAYTFEADSPDAAVREILAQLGPPSGLRKNRAALIFCSLDFIESGVAEAVSRALPCEAVGCTTMGVALPGVAGELILAVAVLTSDEARFSVGVSESLLTGGEEHIAALYRRLTGSLPAGPSASPPASPSLILSFQPLLQNPGGDRIVEILDRLSGGAPVFGTDALDETTEIRSPMTIHNGKAYPDRLALLLISGGGPPRFAMDSIRGWKNGSQKAQITAAEGNRIISIDNIPAAAYVERIGLINQGVVNMLYAFPMAVDNHSGGSATICAILSVNPDGSLMCGGAVSAGSTLYISSPNSQEVLKTAAHITGKIKKQGPGGALLMLSCFSRGIALVDLTEEMRLIQRELADFTAPYIFLYSGGEVCPLDARPDRRINRHYNYAIVSCLV
jgi:hypothetical protein